MFRMKTEMKKHVIVLWAICLLSVTLNVYLFYALHKAKRQDDTGEDRPSSYELQRRTVMVIDSLITQAQTYARIKGEYPKSIHELSAPFDGDGRGGPNDCFGHSLEYEVKDGCVHIRSAGLDGEFSTKDDIVGVGGSNFLNREYETPIGMYFINVDM